MEKNKCGERTILKYKIFCMIGAILRFLSLRIKIYYGSYGFLTKFQNTFKKRNNCLNRKQE
jgi:hypothetical protein